MAETPLSSNGIYNAIPTLRVGGQANARAAEQLVAMEMKEQEGGMSSLELTFSNFGSFADGTAGQVFDDGSVLDFGKVIDVYAGDAQAPTQIFHGRITALEGRYPRSGPPELVVLAEDDLQLARMARRTKTWDDTTLSDLASQVASGLGLKPRVTDLDVSVGTQVQFNETDLQFLRRLLARYDADMQIVGSELHAFPRAGAQRNTLQLNWNGQLRELRVVADLADVVSDTTVTGWDFQQGQSVSATSRTTSFGPGSGTSGKDWLGKALSTRSHHVAQLSVSDLDEAQAIADAELAQRMARFVVAHGVAEGNPELRVGTHVMLNGLGPRFNNTYYVTSALHRFDARAGYETEFTAECAYLGGSA
jgi:phage protein D